MMRVRGCGRMALSAAVWMVACGCSAPVAPVQMATVPAPAVDTRIADEAAIRALDAEWVKAVASKDPAKSADYYTEDVTMWVPGQKMVSGKDAALKSLTYMMALPGFALSFEPDTVVVARAGDVAYEIGNYELTMPDSKGKPETTKAKYFVAWMKQPDGTWKASVDAPTTTQ